VYEITSHIVAGGAAGGGTTAATATQGGTGSVGGRMTIKIPVYPGMVIDGYVGDKGIGIVSANGTDGGNTKFGGITVYGGKGGALNNPGSAAAADSPTVTDWEHISFSQFANRNIFTYVIDGNGAVRSSNGNGNPATDYGGYGSGGYNDAGTAVARTGGNGYRGFVLVEY
jgi:hypothetical protein